MHQIRYFLIESSLFSIFTLYASGLELIWTSKSYLKYVSLSLGHRILADLIERVLASLLLCSIFFNSLRIDILTISPFSVFVNSKSKLSLVFLSFDTFYFPLSFISLDCFYWLLQ